MTRLTIVVDPTSPTPSEHRVVAPPGGAIVGAAGDAQVSLPGLPGHHVRFEVHDARLVVRALAAGVWVRRASPVGVAALVPEVARKGDVLDVHQTRTLREGDVVRLLPVRDGPGHELRVDVGLLALGGRRALVRALPLAGFWFVVLGGLAVRRGLAGVAALVVFATVVTATLAAGTLLELRTARGGATWRRRLLGGAATAAVVTLGLAGALVNLHHASAVAAGDLAAAGAGAVQALAGCGARSVAQRLLTLGLVAALVLDARWWRSPAVSSLITLFSAPVVFVGTLLATQAAGLPRDAGDVVYATSMEEAGYTFATLMIAGVFAFALRDVQRRWPVG